MKNRPSPGAQQVITKTIVIQLVITLIAVFIGALFADFKTAYSAGVGGLIHLVVTLLFAHIVFSTTCGASAAQVVSAFYVGETVKLLATAVLFIVALRGLDIIIKPFLLTYGATFMAYWLVLPLIKDSPVK